VEKRFEIIIAALLCVPQRPPRFIPTPSKGNRRGRRGHRGTAQRQRANTRYLRIGDLAS